MTLSLLHGLPLAGAFLLTALPTADDTLAFDPEAGSTVTKTFRETTTLTLEEANAFMGGEEMPMVDLAIDLEQSRAVAVTDVYGKSANGAPQSLRRTFDNVSSMIDLDLTSPDGDSEVAEIEGHHPLEDLEVKFSWDVDAGASQASFVEDDAGDAELLEGLQVDMDLCSFLVPLEERDAPFAEGERWLVDPASFLALTQPGGIGFVPFEVEEDEQLVGVFVTALLSCRDALDAPTGEVEMWWKNTREIDGHLCAVFDLGVEIEGVSDVSDQLENEIIELLPDVADEISWVEAATIEMSLEGEGELVWDLVTNRLKLVEIELQNQMELIIGGENEGADLELTLSLSGDTVLAVEVD